MILRVGTDGGEIDFRLNSETAEYLGVTDTGELENLWRLDRAVRIGRVRQSRVLDRMQRTQRRG